MIESPLLVVVATIAIIALSAFFVAAEFALIAARRHRLEDAATHSRSARAALRNASELTVLLAGCQLGITVCTLALGAIAKPAVHDWLAPVFESTGLPAVAADVIAFILALFIVTFLHLVIGEMAPKSWAIAHPEKSATMLALPMRAFLWLTRPLLVGLNNLANVLLRRVGVEPTQARSSHQDPAALAHLVEHSATVGVLDSVHSQRLAVALEMESLTVGALVRRGRAVTMVPPTARVADVRAATLREGHLRVLVGTGEDIVGVVHVRDTLTLPDDAPVTPLMRPVLTLDAATSVHAALERMREQRSHLTVITDPEGLVGLVSLTDVVRGLITDTP